MTSVYGGLPGNTFLGYVTAFGKVYSAQERKEVGYIEKNRVYRYIQEKQDLYIGYIQDGKVYDSLGTYLGCTEQDNVIYNAANEFLGLLHSQNEEDRLRGAAASLLLLDKRV